MSTCGHKALRFSADGFTLIEVIGALVVFSMGVLAVVLMSGTLTTTMERAALRSELAVLGQARLDSLEMVDYTSLTVGTTTTYTTMRGQTYEWKVIVSDSTVVMRYVQVTATSSSGSGPSFRGSAFVDRSW